MKFKELTDQEILDIAHKREDLKDCEGEYDDFCILNWCRNCYMHHWDIDDCLDELSHFNY